MTIKNKMLLGALLLVTSAAWAAPATAGSTNTSGISKYELSSFIADFKHFKPGDTVPEMYRTDEYNIKQLLPVFMRVRERQNRKKTTLGIYKEKALSMQRLEGGLFHLMTRFSTGIRA